ncbi:MAG: TlpA family protein disulfide reductase [Flavobacterium sp. JAD_PAG50586_2]|nr:MAG: TlpA family protein disulfide reductase [Flavobacterium sp. JAD_PAG50586_2]
MKKALLCIIATIATFACINAQQKEFSQVSLSKKLTTVDNTQITFAEILKKHEGKVTLIEVWASWCGDCVKAMPKLKELQAKNPGVDYVFISMDKVLDKWLTGIKTHELDGAHYWATDGMKGEFGKSIDLDWIPRYIVIDKNGGIVIYRAIETDFDKINEQLQALEPNDGKVKKTIEKEKKPVKLYK